MTHQLLAFDAAHRLLEFRQMDDPQVAWRTWRGMVRSFDGRGTNRSSMAERAIPQETTRLVWFKVDPSRVVCGQAGMIVMDRRGF